MAAASHEQSTEPETHSAKPRITSRQYQQSIVDSVLKKGNSLVVLPTGLGKTLVGALVMEHFVKQGKRCMFLAPTRPLVAQHVKRLGEYFHSLGYRINAVTGQVSRTDREHLYHNSDIIVATPQCLTPDAMIYIEGRGIVSIGEFVESFDLIEENYGGKNGFHTATNAYTWGMKDGIVSRVKITDVWKLPASEIYEIKTELKNTLKCTPEHSLLTIGSNAKISWKPARNLCAGDWVGLPSGIKIEGRSLSLFTLINCSNLRLADKLLAKSILDAYKNSGSKLGRLSGYYRSTMPLKQVFDIATKCGHKLPDRLLITNSTGRSRALTLPENITPDICYVIGAMLGDGHIGNSKSKGKEVVFSALDKKSVLERFANCIRDSFGLEPKQDLRKGLIYYSTALAEVLIKLGIPSGEKAARIRVPNYLYSLSDDCVKAFLCGVFDTDGSANKHSVSIVATVSERFASDLKWLLLRVSIISSVSWRKQESVFNGKPYNSLPLYIVGFSGDTQITEFLSWGANSEKCAKLIAGRESLSRPGTRSRDVLPVSDAIKEAYVDHRMNGGFPMPAVLIAYRQKQLSKSNIRQILLMIKSKKSDTIERALDMPIRWVRTTSVERTNYGRWVYDVTVEHDHNFIANCLINHNTVRNDIARDKPETGSPADHSMMSHFSCLVVDECHRAIGQYAYTEVAKAATEAGGILILGLTASPGGRMEKIREIMDAMSITNVEIRTEEDADVSKHVQPMRIEWIEVDLSKEIAEAVALLGELMDEKVTVLQQFGMQISKKTARGRLSQMYRSLIEHRNMAALGHFAVFYNAFHGAELLETEGPYSFIKFAERLLERKKNRIDWRFTQAMNKVRTLEHPKMALLLRLLKEREGKRIIVFAQYRDQVAHIVETVNAAGFKSKQFLGKGKGGVATQKTQKETLEEFGCGDFDVLVASSIGEEGIDVPAADTAIFYEPVPSEIRSIQRRGRVGRAKEGEVLILVTRGTRDETFRYVSAAREKKMKGIIKKLSTGEIKHRPRKKSDGAGLEHKPDPNQTEQSEITTFFK